MTTFIVLSKVRKVTFLCSRIALRPCFIVSLPVANTLWHVDKTGNCLLLGVCCMLSVGVVCWCKLCDWLDTPLANTSELVAFSSEHVPEAPLRYFWLGGLRDTDVESHVVSFSDKKQTFVTCHLIEFWPSTGSAFVPPDRPAECGPTLPFLSILRWDESTPG